MARAIAIGGLSILLVLDFIACLLAQIDISLTFAETWGCRFWTIQLSMVSLCGFTLIWLTLLISLSKSAFPAASMVRVFLIFGAMTHLPPAITTLVDYSNSFNTPVSDYCNYTPVTMAVAVLELISGLLHFVCIFIVKDDPDRQNSYVK